MKNEKTLLIKEKQQFPLTIKRLGINGEGVGYFKKQVVFVPGALPGEEVVVEVTKAHPKYAEAIVKKVRKRSEHRVKAPCIVYEQCGGCQLQHLEYSQQLKEKRDILIQAIERHTLFAIEELDIRPTIGMDNPWHYRNKSQFQVGFDHGKVMAGMYSIDSHRLINIPECIVQQPVTNKVTNVVKQILADFKIPIYNEKTRKGIVRTIVTRVGIQTGQVQVMLVTAKKELPRKEAIISEIKNRLPEVVSVMQNINPKRTSIVLGDETIHLSGKEIVEERLEEFTYELSARAFFQLNPEQTVKLYNEVKKAAELTGKEKIVDAYCGVGTIGLWLADGAEEIRGMDIIPEGIEDAKKNAKKHGLENATYFTGKAEELMPKWVKEGWRPDVVVVDPPRTGCDPKFLETILKVKPKKFIYVSCNPSTLAKDLQILSKKYQVEYLQPVDMFPQTAHVECVSQLILKKGN
ncbi:23S rRNA (uracil(1939)-C(5))-methyltransferase RlmD [Heyndrickxia vini]|uniref:23S rRNA (Uracil(1939)-C(5))-methyltransferase RlmD n=1 Tax=Heyndrickxia vini TaxID=1476025 RepID=A0ABX7E0E5_9BACI|nr:23S rRNA (uracil(1939)-C(5))-methyltransferase RlmD [Heyndrickxia vini]QQZ08690.1 23S rRNA (uracil(1939)-C(5))-methyltransferase RlmD [Heyndrickxia vini]